MLPDSAELDAPWTKTLVGSAQAAVTRSILTITDAAAADGLCYGLTIPDFDYETGCIVEAIVRVTASSSGADEGLCLLIGNGEAQYRAWLRAGGVNIDGYANVAQAMTDWRHVILAADGVDCSLLIDHNMLQTGHLASLTDAREVRFGTLAGYGTATADVRWIRARNMRAAEGLADGGWIMDLTGTWEVDDLDVGVSKVLAIDHSDDGVFDIAEAPELTRDDGSSWEDLGIFIQPLSEGYGDDGYGGGFKVVVTNVSYSGYGSGGTGPTITGLWSRRGLKSV